MEEGGNVFENYSIDDLIACGYVNSEDSSD